MRKLFNRTFKLTEWILTGSALILGLLMFTLAAVRNIGDTSSIVIVAMGLSAFIPSVLATFGIILE